MGKSGTRQRAWSWIPLLVTMISTRIRPGAPRWRWSERRRLHGCWGALAEYEVTEIALLTEGFRAATSDGRSRNAELPVRLCGHGCEALVAEIDVG